MHDELFGPAMGGLTLSLSRDEWGQWALNSAARFDEATGGEWIELVGGTFPTRAEALLVALEVLADAADFADLDPRG